MDLLQVDLWTFKSIFQFIYSVLQDETPLKSAFLPPLKTDTVTNYTPCRCVYKKSMSEQRVDPASFIYECNIYSRSMIQEILP